MNRYEIFMLERGLKHDTIAQRITFARARWVEWGTWDLSGAEIGSWLQGHAGWTRSTYYYHLKSLYAWLVSAGIVDHDPTTLIPAPARPRPRANPLDEDELIRALAAADGRVRAFLLLGYLAGLRRFEIAKFAGEDITKARIRVVGKGNVLDYVPTHPLLWELAQQYPRTGYWFPSPQKYERAGEPISVACVGADVAALFRSLGISGSTHRSRHTYGTSLLRGGANLRVVQRLMRHASLATTALYLGVDESEEWSAINGLGA